MMKVIYNDKLVYTIVIWILLGGGGDKFMKREGSFTIGIQGFLPICKISAMYRSWDIGVFKYFLPTHIRMMYYIIL